MLAKLSGSFCYVLVICSLESIFDSPTINSKLLLNSVLTAQVLGTWENYIILFLRDTVPVIHY